MKIKFLSLILCFFVFFTAYAQENNKKIIISEDLEIVPLTEKTFIHVSYLPTESFGRVPCNGLVYINKNEALIFDTPHNNETSKQLIDWLTKTYPGLTIKGVVVNHFHADCLGGLDAFHQLGAKSYAYKFTPDLAKRDSASIPQIVFEKPLKIKVGDENVVCEYFGEAHSKDNIISWIPEEGILFGGCMVKSINAGKGNLADANVNEWANTIKRVKEKYNKAKIVIPGHGMHGGTELLDFTIQLFSSN